MTAPRAARAPGLVLAAFATLATLAACNSLAGLDGLSFREPIVEEELCTPGEKRACYNGPQGSDGVGDCVAGVAPLSRRWPGLQRVRRGGAAERGGLQRSR
jgi:hypothetical protein